jgi:hypothetical protein
MKIFYYLFLLILAQNNYAQTYYLSTSGNDNNDGLSVNTAWQSINKLNSVTLANNDTVLFKRGQTFRGQISSNKFPTGIHFSAYGTGNKPIIAGSIKINHWQVSNFNPHIYQADVSQFISTDKNGVTNTIEQLYVNGQLMTLARYPNVDSPNKTNWLKVGASAGTDAFTDAKLASYAKPTNYWQGATLRIRTYSWFYKVFPITASNLGKITAKGLGTQLPEWGYFIDNKLEELDIAGEWFYDATAKKVYFYPPSTLDLNTAVIEGATYKKGLSIFWHEDDSQVDNLVFKHFTQSAMEINSSNRVTVQNCEFNDNLNGISVWNSADLHVFNNSFNNELNTGVMLNAASDFNIGNSIIEKNTLTNIGMIPLYCARYSGVCYGLAMSVFGKGFIIKENTIENTGWTAIYLKDGGGHLLENNTIRNALSLLNDGGAVAIGSNNNTVRGNFLFNSIGNVDKSNGCGSTNSKPCMHHSSYGMGVGADNNYTNITVENNTIAGNNDWGIRFNAFTNSKIIGNTLFDNQDHIILESTNGTSANNIVSNNIVYSANADEIGVYLTSTTEHGELNNNFYCNPYSDILFNRDNKYYSLSHFQRQFNQETYTKQCSFKFADYKVLSNSAEMFSNTQFNTTVNGWSGGSYQAVTAGLNGGNLQFTNKNTTGFVNYNNLNLQAGQFYRLRFTLKGSDLGNIELRINDTTDYSNLQTRFFAYDTSVKTYDYIFKSPRTTNKGQVILISRAYDAPFYWLDDVSLIPVTVQTARKPAELFINNTAQSKTINLSFKYKDLTGKAMATTLTLAPFSSQILVRP